ncbi:hypothetical protein [Curtobacterium herbarum]|uniref:DUF86 domain-containing protein n=1 Tax=Curtobacterium herbarum TaxID=150122 RepID=A0ABN1ZAY5_9MICO|nr:hypothetical protein [Curtobacterium herbarum]MBM7476666.1 uncharacterized protein with HEPN domain [Curtobacterium herbarum]MCS6546216.1 hypothetical protein [Curtobacterium herbarum]
MTPPVEQSLDDVIASCDRIRAYVSDPALPEALVHDAVRMRLVDIAAAVQRLPPTMTRHEPAVPWAQVSALAERLTRRPAETPASVLLGTARTDVPVLCAAARRMRARCP